MTSCWSTRNSLVQLPRRRNGEARTHPKQCHSVLQGLNLRTPILNEKLTIHRKSTNIAINTAQPRQYQNAHNDVSATPPHPLARPTACRNTTSAQSPALHMQTGFPPAGHCLQLHLGPQLHQIPGVHIVQIECLAPVLVKDDWTLS